MMPHVKPRWELYHDESASAKHGGVCQELVHSFKPAVGAIRSWDPDVWSVVSCERGSPRDYIVIIDSMCNLDLLFYASPQTGDKHLAHVDETHGQTLLKSHLRLEPKQKRLSYDGPIYSTYHIANFSSTGAVMERLTGQGYSALSTWSRGQAWAILGYAQTYTGKSEFLDAACGLAEYFLYKLESAPVCVEIECINSRGGKRTIGRYVPVWDFDALAEEFNPPLRDTSAGTCAANGLLILSQALTAMGNHTLSSRYFDAAMRIVEDTIAYSLSQDKARIAMDIKGRLHGVDHEADRTFEAILRNATVTNNPMGLTQIRDHGLVYADYYLIEFKTRILRMGLA